MNNINDRVWQILLVEDNPQDRDSAKAALRAGSRRRYQFTEVTLADEATSLCARPPLNEGVVCASTHFDCMVLDFELPDGNALDVLARLPRDADGLTLLPVVILTGAVSSDTNRAVLRAGAHDYVGKSWLGAESLTRALDNAMERHAMGRELNRHRARQQLTLDITRAAEGDSELAMAKLLQRIGAIVGADIQLQHGLGCDPGPPYLQLLAHAGLDAAALSQVAQLPLAHTLWGQANQEEQAVARSHMQHAAESQLLPLRRWGVRAFVCYPLRVSEQNLGSLCFGSRSQDEFSAEDLEFLADMALQVALHAQRQRVDHELRRSEAFNNSLLNSSTDCVILLSVEGRLLHVNRSGRLLLELDDMASTLNKPWQDLWPSKMQAQATAALACAAGGEAAAMEGTFVGSKQSPRWLEVHLSPVRDALSGEVLRLLVIARDSNDKRHQAATWAMLEKQKDQQQRTTY
jgi:PAS domain S-box-containing protein